MKASPQTQLRLLELADLDAELARLDHRRRGLPEVAELARLEARASELKDAIVVTETELGDLTREQSRAERDVDQVRTRIEKDRARLDAGQVSAARELASLQSEIESLHRRQGDLEEVVLELMERRESARSAGETSWPPNVTASAARRPRWRLGATRPSRRSTSRRPRHPISAPTVAAEVPADLLKLYDQIRKTKGVGAAMLRGRPVRGMPPEPQCGGPERRSGRRRRMRWSGARSAGGSSSAPPSLAFRCAPGPTGCPPRASPPVTLLLRHGQTPMSVQKRYAGRSDVPLTETGVRQAAAAAKRLASAGIDVIVASPLQRAVRTAAGGGGRHRRPGRDR